MQIKLQFVQLNMKCYPMNQRETRRAHWPLAILKYIVEYLRSFLARGHAPGHKKIIET